MSTWAYIFWSLHGCGISHQSYIWIKRCQPLGCFWASSLFCSRKLATIRLSGGRALNCFFLNHWLIFRLTRFVIKTWDSVSACVRTFYLLSRFLGISPYSGVLRKCYLFAEDLHKCATLMVGVGEDIEGAFQRHALEWLSCSMLGRQNKQDPCHCVVYVAIRPCALLVGEQSQPLLRALPCGTQNLPSSRKNDGFLQLWIIFGGFWWWTIMGKTPS